jgi:hypothetical protein
MQTELKKYYEPFIYLLLLIQLVLLILKMHFSISIIPKAFSPDAALKQSLSKEVIEASNLIKKNSLMEFSLSPEFNNDGELVQRMGEFNYPVRLKDNALIIVAKPIEKEFNKCKLIEAGVYTAIYDCSNRKH